MTRPIHELDRVILTRDVPEAGLRACDLGAVVHAYDETTFEVEFVMALGRTQAVQTLGAADIRQIRDDDHLAVRLFTPVPSTPLAD